MSKDDRFYEFLIQFLQFMEDEYEHLFFEFLENNFHVKDIIQWYVEFQHAESTQEA